MGTARSVALLISSVVLSSTGQTLLKLGLNRLTAEQKATPLSFVISAMTNLTVLGGLALFACSVLIWMRVLADSQISWGYPLLGLSYVFVALAGWLVFGERLSAQRLLGIGIVILGAVLVGRS